MGVDVQRATSQPLQLPECKIFSLGNRRQGDVLLSTLPEMGCRGEASERSFLDIQVCVTGVRQELQK